MPSFLCDHVLRCFDAADAAREAHRIDYLDLRWDECHRRAFAKRSHGGRAVRVLLQLGTVLRDGDVIADTADCLLIIRVVPCQVLVVKPASIAEAALAALELGNLHVPVQVRDKEVLTPADGPAAGVLQRRRILFTTESRIFQPTPIEGVTWTIADRTLSIASPTR